MRLVGRAVASIRGQIAALINRFAPDYYKQIIERRHAGVQVQGDASSDVRGFKEQSLAHMLRALESVNLPALAKIDNRHCWVILADSGEGPNALEALILKLLDYGLRVTVTIEGHRAKRVSGKKRLRKLLKRQPGRIHSIKAGMVWMRDRGYRHIGWYAAARVHFYDWNETKNAYCARRDGSLPPMIDKKSQSHGITVAGLSKTESRLDKIRFPIDVVYTWVDGNDRAWNEKRKARASEIGHKLHKLANSQTRYINRDELRYSLRSLYYYAPWVRNVFLVTDDQVPDWYDSDSKDLTIVSHKELFPDESSLPTFNSHAIESVLHRIPELSEHFIYMNDDVFFSSVIQPEVFFEVSGICRAFLSRAMIPLCRKEQSDVASEWGVMNANELLREAYGVMMPYKTKHTPIALRKSLLADLESRYSEQFQSLRGRPFRTANDLAPTTSLHVSFGLAEGKVVRGTIAYRYLNLARPNLGRSLDSIAHSRHSLVYCLNDTEIDDQSEFDWVEQERLITDFFKSMYPYQAPWESGR